MAIILSGSPCPKCHSDDSMKMDADAAAHDAALIDIVLSCGNCESRFNSFIAMADMDELGV